MAINGRERAFGPNCRARASWTAPVPWRFLSFESKRKSARRLAQSKTIPYLDPAILIACLVATSISAATIPIAVNGAARSTIVLGKNAQDLDRLAASELESYIEKLSGVRIKQISETEVGSLAANETILLLGAENQNGIERDLEASGNLKTSGLKPEGFVLET